jgi:hypothetical protein
MLVALLVAAPTTLHAATGGSDIAPAGYTATDNNMSAAEAARLAALAADMAQRAAQMANAPQQSTSAPADAGVSTLSWRPRGQADHQASQTAATQFGSGSHQPAAQTADNPNGQPLKRLFSTEEKSASTLAAASTSATSQPREKSSVEINDAESNGGLKLSDRTFTDSEVVPAADATYPETLLSGSDLSTPVSYDACCGTGCSTGCDPCCDPCGDCRPPLFWVVGVEATFLKPDLSGSTTTYSIVDETATVADFTAHSDDVDSFYAAPRLWLGIQGCKWGMNLRYWHLQASESSFDTFFDEQFGQDWGLVDEGYFSYGRLEAYTVDLEITRLFCCRDCWMQFSFGVRHAEFEQSQGITGLTDVSDAFLPDDTTAILAGYGRSDSITRGTGIVLGLYGRQPLFPCSCIHVFYNLRGSVLWGPTETYAETSAQLAVDDVDAIAIAGSANGAHTAVNDDLFIGEVQLGLEWNYALRCVPANAFVRGAVEYQRWDGGAGFSEAGSFATVDVSGDEATVETTSTTFRPQLDLIGIAVGTGLTW